MGHLARQYIKFCCFCYSLHSFHAYCDLIWYLDLFVRNLDSPCQIGWVSWNAFVMSMSVFCWVVFLFVCFVTWWFDVVIHIPICIVEKALSLIFFNYIFSFVCRNGYCYWSIFVSILQISISNVKVNVSNCLTFFMEWCVFVGLKIWWGVGWGFV